MERMCCGRVDDELSAEIEQSVPVPSICRMNAAVLRTKRRLPALVRRDRRRLATAKVRAA